MHHHLLSNHNGPDGPRARAVVTITSFTTEQIVLSVLYLIFCAILGIQFTRYIYSRRQHSASFHATFLGLALVWTFLRAIYWISSYWPFWVQSAVYWSPLFFHFLFFSLTILFFAKGVYWRDWREKRSTCYATTAASNLMAFAATLGWTILYARQDSCDANPFLWAVYGAGIAAAYATLLVTSLYFGSKIISLFLSNKVPMSVRTVRARVVVVAVVFISVVVSASKCGYGIFCILQYNDPTFVGDNGLCGNTTTKEAVLLGLWELLPIFVALLYFRKIEVPDSDALGDAPISVRVQSPKSYGTVYPHRPHPVVGASDTASINSSEAKIFSNPRRYDSDDECDPVLSTGVSSLSNEASFHGNASFRDTGSFPRQPPVHAHVVKTRPVTNHQ